MDTPEATSRVLVQVGRTFDLMLQSMAGSTGYAWCLKQMPAGIELISVASAPIHPGIAPTRQTFTFAALQPLRDGKIEFDLLCLHDLLRPIPDQRTFLVDVYAANENDALKEQVGAQKFVAASGTMIHGQPIVPYGFPDPKKIIPLYGFPPHHHECGLVMTESTTNCVVKYGHPFGVGLEGDACNMKYGYPVPLYGVPAPLYGYPIHYKYGFPLTFGPGEPVTVEENPENCLLMYGTPSGVADKPEECLLKYGFPKRK